MRGLEDYSRTLEEFQGRFATEQACPEYLKLRWRQGVCPRCGGAESSAQPAWPAPVLGNATIRLRVSAGHDLPGHDASLRTWFRTMWWVTSQKNGASALGLQSILGLGSYRTAWALLHKLPRDGAARPRTAQRSRGGRRDLCGPAEEGLADGNPEKSTGRHRRR